MERVAARRPGTARELARRAMTAQVSAMAFDLFVERGYEATTVEDICAVAGISRSTFFRYFASKEDVLLDDLADSGDELLAALCDRPDDEAPWTALRHALGPLVRRCEAEPERARRLAALVGSTPALAAWHHEKTASWHRLLGPEVARRLGAKASGAGDPRPAALVAAAVGCVDATIAAWVAGDGDEPVGRILDRAMGALQELPS